MIDLTELIVPVGAVVFAVVIFWNVVMPFLSGAKFDETTVPQSTRIEVERLLDLGNRREAAKVLQQVMPMTVRRARQCIAHWAKRRASMGPDTNL